MSLPLQIFDFMRAARAIHGRNESVEAVFRRGSASLTPTFAAMAKCSKRFQVLRIPTPLLRWRGNASWHSGESSRASPEPGRRLAPSDSMG
jgi:hypothetical protein